MFDNLYDNIGGKIKGLAKCMFIVETIGAIITGIVLLLADSTLVLYGLLTMFFGPVVAWVSSWILYAFGELIERTCDNEYNTRNILKALEETQLEKNDNYTYTKQETVVNKLYTTEIDGFCIEEKTLKKYTGNKNEIIIPENISVVGEQAFSKNNNVISITIPESITTISEWAFYNCKNLEIVKVANSVTAIGQNAFYGCQNIKIYASIGSFAEQYAKENNIPFVAK